MTLKEIAIKALGIAGRPLPVGEIIDTAKKHGLLATVAKDPIPSLRTILFNELKNKADVTPFEKVGRGLFALKMWGGQQVWPDGAEKTKKIDADTGKDVNHFMLFVEDVVDGDQLITGVEAFESMSPHRLWGISSQARFLEQLDAGARILFVNSSQFNILGTGVLDKAPYKLPRGEIQRRMIYHLLFNSTYGLTFSKITPFTPYKSLTLLLSYFPELQSVENFKQAFAGVLSPVSVGKFKLLEQAPGMTTPLPATKADELAPEAIGAALVQLGVLLGYDTYTSLDMEYEGCPLRVAATYQAVPNFGELPFVYGMERVDIVWFRNRFPIAAFCLVRGREPEMINGQFDPIHDFAGCQKFVVGTKADRRLIKQEKWAEPSLFVYPFKTHKEIADLYRATLDGVEKKQAFFNTW